MEEIPQNTVTKVEENLIPQKSRATYNKEYEIFCTWKDEHAISNINETVLMVYFQELSEKYSPNSLWTKYSILKSTLIVNENIDISQFLHLVAFLKRKSKGYVPKKSKILEGEQVLTFLQNAPNEIYLLHKVVLVMGVFGGLRRGELVKMTTDDIEDRGSVILVKVSVSKTSTLKHFTIIDEENINALSLVRQYASLRPPGIKERRFFLTYRNGRCTVQPVGKNTIGSVPTIIAKYLKLDNAKAYTGHCLRRTSFTLLAGGGATFQTLKIDGKWKSSMDAEEYVENMNTNSEAEDSCCTFQESEQSNEIVKEELKPIVKREVVSPRPNENNNDLSNLSTEELIQKIEILQAHNQQLKNIISKQPKNETRNNQRQKPFDFNKCTFRHILLKFYYLGWNYNGYVVQEDTDNTIEHHIFNALTKTCLIKDRASSNYHRCGRTDKGVSSFGQTISIDVRSKLSKDNQHNLEEEIDYCVVLNKVLPSDIQCISWCPVEEDYSARFNCSSRTYRYFFPKGNLNIETMKTAADFLIGTHDYRNFCKMDVGNGVVEFVRKIETVEIRPVDSNEDKTEYTMFEVIIRGSGFLWHQIRCIIGVLFLIGQEKEQPQVILELLDVEKNPCKPDYNMVSEIPLNLFTCEYDIPAKWQCNAENLIHILKKLKSMWTVQTAKTTMIKSMLLELEEMRENTENNSLDHTLTDCLMQGSKSRKYVPLMKRPRGESLEKRIEHFSKRRKLRTQKSEQ